MTTPAATRVVVRAHAKVNLWLRVIAREADGYHGIETHFHRLELADDVTVSLAPHGRRSVECSVDVCPPRENLAYRAAESYCAAQEWATGFHIGIVKRIPAAGGLGGGSADAAATLRALNALSPRAFTDAELSELGARLGADVPFLLTDAPAALAWGHGDRMLELPALPQRWIALVVPPFGISTAESYRTVPISEFRPGTITVPDLTDWAGVARLGGNDLSQAAPAAREGGLERAATVLRDSGARLAGMTGSGSVVFGVFESEPDARALESATGWEVIVTRTSLGVEAPHRLD